MSHSTGIKKINLKKVWGFKNTSWGLVFIVLSDYFENSKNKTIISAALTKDNMSNYIHKTPDQCNENELVNEMFRQLNLSFQNITPPDHYVMNQNIYKKRQMDIKTPVIRRNKIRFHTK